MIGRRFVVASALLVPALVFASCSDDGNTNPAAPQLPQEPQVPGTPGGGVDLRKLGPLTIPEAQLSAAELAEIVKADAAAEAFSTTTTGDLAPHDPTVPGMRVRCIDGADIEGLFEGAFTGGSATRFRTNHGCELDTRGAGEGAAVVTSQNLLGGRLLSRTQRLQFYYAGGSFGEEGSNISPAMVLFIDRCTFPDPVDLEGAHRACPSGTSTDGHADDVIIVSPETCHDEPEGSLNVGAVIVVGPNEDETCVIVSSLGPGTWEEYLEANPGARYARTLLTQTGSIPLRSLILQAGPDKHYLIYRVAMRAGTGS